MSPSVVTSGSTDAGSTKTTVYVLEATSASGAVYATVILRYFLPDSFTGRLSSEKVPAPSCEKTSLPVSSVYFSTVPALSSEPSAVLGSALIVTVS